MGPSAGEYRAERLRFLERIRPMAAFSSTTLCEPEALALPDGSTKVYMVRENRWGMPWRAIIEDELPNRAISQQ
jgi:hypothetical protein